MITFRPESYWYHTRDTSVVGRVQSRSFIRHDLARIGFMPPGFKFELCYAQTEVVQRPSMVDEYTRTELPYPTTD